MYIYKQPVIQFTKYSDLVRSGRAWHSSVWGRPSNHTFTSSQLKPFESQIKAQRKTQGIPYPIRPSSVSAFAGIHEDQKHRSQKERSEMKQMEMAELTPIAAKIAKKMPEGFSLTQGYQPYDPVIKMDGQKPRTYKQLIPLLNHNAVQNAQLLITFMQDESELEDLPPELQELAVIAFVAETGRGYSPDALYDFAQRIIESEGDINWSHLKKGYPAAMTYSEDSKDFSPPDWDKDSDSSGGGGFDGGFGGSGAAPILVD